MNLKSTGFFDTLNGAMKSFPVSPYLLPFLLLILISVNGCSIFGSIGDAISDGYQNTVAYFNSYYNASRAFQEAEAEIAATDKNAGVHGFTDKPQILSSTARQRLMLVIDKSSNILQFYPSSALVDDALMLIGESYYYQGDYLKAERKFTEFLSRYPDSPLNLEVRLWYLRTLARLHNDETAIKEGESLLLQATNQEETEIAAGASDVLGILYERMNDHEHSLAMYNRFRDLASDDELKAWGFFRAGEKLVELQRLEEAARMFEFAVQYSEDVQFQFRCSLERVRTLRSLGRFEESLQGSNELLDDFRFAPNAKEARFERGLTYVEAKRFRDAEDDLVAVDTTSARSELGSRASFELAKLYEHVKGDYRAARDSYMRSTSFPASSIAVQARKKQAGLTRYLLLLDERSKLDSLMLLGEKTDTVAVDSAGGRASVPDRDSLAAVLAVNSYELGELFYIDIENPDSAAYRYRQAIEGIDDSVRTPRIRYILAELALADTSLPDSNGQEMLRSIVRMYPKSVYATRAKIQLGIPLDSSETDNGAILYKRAEARIDSGEYGEAITTLKKITMEYPYSPFAAKSTYTMGWLYENRLSRPDSALKEYKALIRMYAASPYAAAVRPRVHAIEAATDTTSTSPTKVLKREN